MQRKATKEAKHIPAQVTNSNRSHSFMVLIQENLSFLQHCHPTTAQSRSSQRHAAQAQLERRFATSIQGGLGDQFGCEKNVNTDYTNYMSAYTN